ncbi:sensor protein kdpD [Asticcacaulis biprosthecium C19]|uniref:histidine kinase n=1 Tax=Asticcacaulis biprosthecium C19 TaxID=715226 RepID=F4QMG6_9CAUL|nr:ATP-binding protein [Asticcacaulis biprosthecium]EGF91407.1 sensor protein kdpD [Asticcacaulis biprosthecium C19]
MSPAFIFEDHVLAVRKNRWTLWQEGLLSFALVAGVTGVAFALDRMGFPSPESLGILFVLPVLCAAVFFDLRLALATVGLSVIAYHLVLSAAYGSLDVSNPQVLAKVVVLLTVSLVVSALATRLRRITREGQTRENFLTDLYQLNQDLIGKTSVDDVCAAAEHRLSVILQAPCRIHLKPSSALDPVFVEVMTRRQPAGQGQAISGEDPRLILPLGEADDVAGVLVFEPRAGLPPVADTFPQRFLSTLTGQVALAISRAALTEARTEQVRQADRERFMSAMLSSLSHDFKTPLVGIIGALEALQGRVDDTAHEIVGDGLAEAQRLNRFVINLIEMSRLETGIRPKCEPVHIRDALSGVLRTLRPLIGHQTFRIEIEPGFPLLNVNPSMFDLVLLNLIENALKYGPAEGAITIGARQTADGVVIDIDDDGEGIAPAQRDLVFTKFYRAVDGDRKIAGTGLGLYICREIMDIYSGSVEAVDPPDGTGACMRLSLPTDATLLVTLPEEEVE